MCIRDSSTPCSPPAPPVRPRACRSPTVRCAICCTGRPRRAGCRAARSPSSSPSCPSTCPSRRSSAPCAGAACSRSYGRAGDRTPRRSWNSSKRPAWSASSCPMWPCRCWPSTACGWAASPPGCGRWSRRASSCCAPTPFAAGSRACPARACSTTTGPPRRTWSAPCAWTATRRTGRPGRPSADPSRAPGCASSTRPARPCRPAPRGGC